MNHHIEVAEISIEVTLKAVKNVHLTVHPPDGKVTLVAPTTTRLEVARAYAISKLGWIRKQQSAFREQERESPRRYVGRETHYLWGERYLLEVQYNATRNRIEKQNDRLVLSLKDGVTGEGRAEIIARWHRSLLHAEIPALINKWEKKFEVSVSGYSLRRMKTKWGSCNTETGSILLNTELVKKPKQHLDYIVAHEVAHILVPDHSEKFIRLLNDKLPSWRDLREELNSLPIQKYIDAELPKL